MTKNGVMLKNILFCMILLPMSSMSAITLKKIINDSPYAVFIWFERPSKKRSDQPMPTKIEKGATVEFTDGFVVPIKDPKEKNADRLRMWWVSMNSKGDKIDHFNWSYYFDGTDTILAEHYAKLVKPTEESVTSKNTLKKVSPDADVMVVIDSQGDDHWITLNNGDDKKNRRKTLYMQFKDKVADWREGAKEGEEVATADGAPAQAPNVSEGAASTSKKDRRRTIYMRLQDVMHGYSGESAEKGSLAEEGTPAAGAGEGIFREAIAIDEAAC